jgi:hypothetical protein
MRTPFLTRRNPRFGESRDGEQTELGHGISQGFLKVN